jgi:hypothetical protein
MYQVKGSLRVFLIASMALGFLGFVLVRHIYYKKQSDAYHEAKMYVQKDTALITRVGEIREYGLWISGDIDDEEGIANLHFDVIGSRDAVVVSVSLEKTSYSGWVVKKMSFK